MGIHRPLENKLMNAKDQGSNEILKMRSGLPPNSIFKIDGDIKHLKDFVVV